MSDESMIRVQDLRTGDSVLVGGKWYTFGNLGVETKIPAALWMPIFLRGLLPRSCVRFRESSGAES